LLHPAWMLGTGRVSELVVVAGGTDGKVLVFDLRTGEPVASHTASADTLNGFQFHPFLPLAATASGAGLLLFAFNTAIVITQYGFDAAAKHII
jgi:WD40 repeat protein